MKLLTPAFHFSANCGIRSPNAMMSLLMLLNCENGKVPPAGPVNVPMNGPASDVELAP